jgi:hypothetical protein
MRIKRNNLPECIRVAKPLRKDGVPRYVVRVGSRDYGTHLSIESAIAERDRLRAVPKSQRRFHRDPPKATGVCARLPDWF